MKIIELPVSITRREVLHFLGYPTDREPPERIEQVLTSALDEARALNQAQGCHREVDIALARELGLTPVEAEALVIGIVTAGPAIEARVSELMSRGELTRALILDAAGSAAAEEAADMLGARVAGSEESSETISCRLSPGYGRWALSSQPAVFARLPHAELGVSLTPSFMMMPRKSISFAMWLGAAGRISTGIAGCARCTLAHCRYRRSS